MKNQRKTSIPIGQAAEQLGTTLRTIRFYEERGLIRTTRSNERGERLLDVDAVERLKAVRSLKRWGLSLLEIKNLAARNPSRLPGLTKTQKQARVKAMKADRDRLEAEIASLQKEIDVT